MNELKLISRELISSYEGAIEHFQEFLVSVNANQANKRVIKDRHTIWEIVNHCTFWINAVIDVINGEMMPRRIDDWPSIGNNETDWKNDQRKLISSLEKLIHSVDSFNIKNIHDDVPGDHYPYTYLQMFFRVAYHNIHHLGQIAILRARDKSHHPSMS